jgi:hypothetical protein
MIQIDAGSLKSTPELEAGIVWGDTLEAEYQLFATLVPAEAKLWKRLIALCLIWRSSAFFASFLTSTMISDFENVLRSGL